MPLTLYVARASGSSSQILRVLRHMNDGKTVEVEVVVVVPQVEVVDVDVVQVVPEVVVELATVVS